LIRPVFAFYDGGRLVTETVHNPVGLFAISPGRQRATQMSEEPRDPVKLTLQFGNQTHGVNVS
jgi:hypothetical protein